MSAFGRFQSMFNLSETKSNEPADIPFVIPRKPSKSAFFRSLSKEAESLIESLNLELYMSSDGDEYFYADDHIGRLWFKIEYNADKECLMVWIDKICNLPSYTKMSPYAKKESSNNFFLRVYLSPFNDRRCVQTKTKRRTLSPKFDEMFTFELSPEHFDERSLKMVVHRVDMFRRPFPIGHIVFPLSEYTLKKKTHLSLWKDFLKDETETNCLCSELHCSLVYNDFIERLTLTIMEAKDLCLVGDPSNWGVYLKVEMCMGTRKIKTKKTSVLRGSQSPNFNVSFNFHISLEKLDQASIIVTLYQTKPERIIGRLMFGGVMFTRDKSLQHWQDMLANMKTAISEWHFLKAD